MAVTSWWVREVSSLGERVCSDDRTSSVRSVPRSGASAQTRPSESASPGSTSLRSRGTRARKRGALSTCAATEKVLLRLRALLCKPWHSTLSPQRSASSVERSSAAASARAKRGAAERRRPREKHFARTAVVGGSAGEWRRVSVSTPQRGDSVA